MLTVPRSEQLWHDGPPYYTAEALADAARPEEWQRLSAGDGAKGPRLYDWALVELWRLQVTPEEQTWGHYLLVRRSIPETPEGPAELA